MADPASLGLGAGGGAGVAGIVWLIDKFMGSGKTTKEIRRDLEVIVEKMLTPILKKVEEMHTWHDIPDPSDPANKIWYFSVALRKLLEGVSTNLDASVDVQKELISRFDRYNSLMEKLADAVARLEGRLTKLEDAVEHIRGK